MAAAFFGTLARIYPATWRQVLEVCNITAPTASLKYSEDFSILF
jgi:hypothetical protein